MVLYTKQTNLENQDTLIVRTLTVGPKMFITYGFHYNRYVDVLVHVIRAMKLTIKVERLFKLFTKLFLP